MEILRKRLNKKGFTLVELLVVIAIIAILSVTAYVALGGQTAKARNSRRMSDLSTIQSALEIYFISHDNQYPADFHDLEGKEINELPVDPITDADYSYAASAGARKTFQLATHLEDEEGGTNNTAYVIGNGSDLIDGKDYNSGDGTCSGSCKVTDGSTTCVPYCLY